MNWFATRGLCSLAASGGGTVDAGDAGAKPAAGGAASPATGPCDQEHLRQSSPHPAAGPAQGGGLSAHTP